MFLSLLLTISAGLQGFVADFKNAGLIGGAAIGQNAGLVLKSLAAIVLNSAVLKLVAHGVGVGDRLLYRTEICCRRSPWHTQYRLKILLRWRSA